jgi:hypothetical protein
MVLTIVLGPQLAVKLREGGRESAKTGGKVFYRLALGGLLLGLALTLLQWTIATSGMYILLAIRQIGFIAVVVLYLVGFALLIRATMQWEVLTGDNGMALELAALFIPLLCVPVVIFLVIPNIMFGSYLESWLLSAAEIAWVFTAILVVKD